ncbi:MAG: four helix bundle protein [Chitinophagales bacterium]|jgi:four helix bundle protein
MKSNVILDKTFSFSIKIVELYKELLFRHKVYDLARQILKSGTSIGANAQEAFAGISKKDFRAKFSISLKR